ncbi:type II toxin-antitoxin system HipA family toxin [Piscinibacter terrae]|uniref:Type II toxin-antitoxin system HipA family toxin n=1 Tax=Piscinibacter terrae TaxID=2496871 RepID=A0A3N7HMK5_9BURK|nr:HipA domain-containing protein [Albitalea terrae]RQP23350.1 type II toxin-antitoxin system HipA family toxin [Albitalea terrae]
MTSEAAVYVWIWLPGCPDPVVCGRFTRHSLGSGAHTGTFVYGQSYLTRPQALAIDPIVLPLNEQPVTTTHLNGWFSVLQDSGPDDWGRRLIDRLHGPQDDLGYLLLSRGQSVGALGFSTDPDTPPAGHGQVPGTSSLKRLIDIHRIIEAGGDVDDDDRELLVQGTSAGGARPKTTIEAAGSLWLAKFPSARDNADLPPVPIMEATLLSLAQECGIRVPAHRLVRVGKAPVLLVERFDRDQLPGGGHGRRRYASAKTLLWSQPEVQMYSFMGSYTNLANRMRVWERTPSAHIRELYQRIAFNCLVGNTDDHDRNTGFVANEDGFFELSPAFDLTARPATRRMMLAMAFGAEGAAVTLDNLLSESNRFGVTADEAQHLVHAQWQTIKASLVDLLRANGCAARTAKSALASMPGQVFFSS